MTKAPTWRLRVATFNIQYAKPTRTDRGTELFEPIHVSGAGEDSLMVVRAAIDDLNADVVALQEVDEARARSGRVPQTDEIARFLEHDGKFAEAPGWAIRKLVPRLPMLRKRKGRVFGGYGNALFTRCEVTHWETIVLGRFEPWIRKDPAGKRGIKGYYWRRPEQRVAGFAVVKPVRPDGTSFDDEVIVVSTHLSTHNSSARKQLREVAEKVLDLRAQRGGIPAVILGDLNLQPDEAEAALKGLGFEALAESLTFPNWKPRTQIDHILGIGLESGPSEVRHYGVSDHAALATEVWPKATQG